ncbi:hypothetical protein ACN47E_006758 [Coniothyrium glycines]
MPPIPSMSYESSASGEETLSDRMQSLDVSINHPGLSSDRVSSVKSVMLARINTTNTLTDVLEDVAQEGNISLVKAAIALGADPVFRSSSKLKKVKHEALTRATLNGQAKVVDYLLRRGATYGQASKKDTFTPLDKALLAAAYKEHVDLVACLIHSHGANPLVEQWPREMNDMQHYWAESQVRLPKSSVMDAISKWNDIAQGMKVVKIIMQHSLFRPDALVAGVFDTKSELQSADFGHRPWHTTYEYSALSCFVRAGWADAVDLMLKANVAVKEIEKEDEVLQYQDKVTCYVSPISALTKETWEKRPEDALRILKQLIDSKFSLGLVQRTATDLGQRTALGRAISADAVQGIELILQSMPGLVRDELWFRRSKKETRALPLAAALSLECLESARVLLRAGAHPRDPAFDNMNVLQYTAHQGGETCTAILREMVELAPELVYSTLDIAIARANNDAVSILLDVISSAAAKGYIASLPPVYEMLLRCTNTDVDIEIKARYLHLVDTVVTWDAGRNLQRPQLPIIMLAIRGDNYLIVERLLQTDIVDGRTLGLNSKAHLPGDQGLWTMLECCELTSRSAEWLGLLRSHGAPLYQ